MAEDQRPSEFGGRPGLVQRSVDGHVPSASEGAYLLKQVDPADDTTPPLIVGERADAG